MIFLSLGAGIQSSVMLMRAINGDIDRPDHVIFADTGWEPNHTYRHVDWCHQQCGKARIPFHTVSNGNIREDTIGAQSRHGPGRKQGYFASIPLFIDIDGYAAMGKRQCTREYKITPIRKKQRELLGYKPRQRIPEGSCVVMMGISTDEARRASPSRDRWVDNIYPLIDPLKMSRVDCQVWWENHFPHINLKKSACIGCPFRTDKEWLHMSRTNPDEFRDACEFDEQIRVASGMKGESFLHRSLRPLSEISLNESQMDLSLEDELYCAGGCGL